MFDGLIKRLLGIIFIFFVAIGCTPHSLEEFEEEGEGVMRALIEELQAIHNREQLLAASGRLQKQFDRLVDIMIAAKEFSRSHPDLEKEESIQHELSDQLRIELNRLYQLEGGRQIIEKSQEKALHRLDAFEQKHAKQEPIPIF
jgi:hypothetical protein